MLGVSVLKNKVAQTLIVDLDWYFNQVAQNEYKLNVDCGLARLKSRQLLF